MAGNKHDSAKPKLDLIYPMFLIWIAQVLEEGDQTYGNMDWKHLAASRIIGAIKRHTLAIESGELMDPKSKKPHAAHIASGCMFLVWMQEHDILSDHGDPHPQDDRRWRSERRGAGGVATTIATPHPDAPPGGARWLGEYDPVPAGGRPSDACPHNVPYRYNCDKCDVDFDRPMHTTTKEFLVGLKDPGMLQVELNIPIPWPLSNERNIDALIKEIVTWADEAVGPDRTYENAIRKLVMEELPELLLAPEDPLEYADVLLIVLDLAYLAKIDIFKAIRDKLAINRQRTWTTDKRTGLRKHVGSERTPPKPEIPAGPPNEHFRSHGNLDVQQVKAPPPIPGFHVGEHVQTTSGIRFTIQERTWADTGWKYSGWNPTHGCVIAVEPDLRLAP